jgi:hypothetical protein
LIETEILFLGSLSGTKRLFRSMSLGQLAGHIRTLDYQVQVVDFVPQMTDQQVFQLLDKFISKSTKVVGYSTMGKEGPTAGETKRFVEVILPYIRKLAPNILVVCGGAASGYVTQRYPNKTAFDYIFYGYSENTFANFVNFIFRKGSPPVIEKRNGNLIIREKTQQEYDIKKNHHRWHERDCILPHESLPIEIARGCIFKCKFCAFPNVGKKKNEYVRGMEFVEEEMLYNYEHYKTVNYYLTDDTFNDDPDKVRAFYEMTQRLPFQVNVTSFARADLLWAHPETPELMAESGFVATYFGIESFNERAAMFVGKPWSFKHAQNYLAKLRHDIWKDRVSFRCSMICGLPGDTRKDYLNWHRWYVDNNIPNWSWHPLLLQRDRRAAYNSDIDQDAEKFGYTWITENGMPIWKNTESGLTWRDALEYYTELEALKTPYQVPTSFSLIEEVNYCNLDPRKHNFTRNVDADQVRIQEARRQRLDEYFKKLLAL